MKKAELRFTGSGGQGVILATIILAEAAYEDKLQTVQSQSYGPEARGGLCKAECIIDEKPITYTKVGLPTLLLSLTQASLDKYVKDLQEDIEGKNIIVVEDILDSGRTLGYLRKHMMAKGANKVSIVTLLDKPERRVVDVFPDYTGFNVPDEFVVGYGLDYAEEYRNLPFIGVLKPSVYQD